MFLDPDELIPKRGKDKIYDEIMERAGGLEKSLDEELKELEARWKAVEREASDGARNLEAMSAAVEGFKKRLSETGWSEEKEQAHESALREAKQEVRRLTEVRRLLSVCWGRMTDPTSPDSGWREVQGSPP